MSPASDFFSEFVRHMAVALDVQIAFVSLFTNCETRMRMLAMWDGGQVHSDMEYDVAPTPCVEVMKGRIFHCPRDVRVRFPNDPHLRELGAESYRGVPLVGPSRHHRGHIGAVDTKPMEDEPRFVTVMQMFAARAAAELDRVEAETALALSHARLDGVLQSTKDAIITAELGLRIAIANRSAARIFGTPGSSLSGQSLDAFLTPPLRDWLRAETRPPRHGPESKPNGEATTQHTWLPEGARCRRHDGHEFPVEGSMSRVSIADREYITLVLNDVEEKQRELAQITLLERDRDYLSQELAKRHGTSELVGCSPAMTEIIAHIDRVASTDATVLITGETGTGKEVIARAIHARSKRRHRPLVRLNCAALSSSLIESELFGHEKGSFTGANQQRLGRFEIADGATLFLDEIGELPLDLQPKLLRVLQEGELERVGSSETRTVDVRILAASNRDLRAMAKTGRFRDDLYYRLIGFPLHLRPLRERTEDIVPLAEHFLARLAREYGRQGARFSESAIAELHAYPWPGNVRELRSVVERALISSTGDEVSLSPLGNEPRAPAKRQAAAPEQAKSQDQASAQAEPIGRLEDVERRHIERVLEHTGGVIEGPSGAAKLLDIKPSTLRSRMRRLGVKRVR